MTIMANGRETQPVSIDDDALAWIESFATVWESQQGRRMDGRVLGLLMLSSEPHLSAPDIARILNASAGAVSMATRALVSVGFIMRHTVPGDRRHYFRADEDVWGAFLLGERDYLRRLSDVLRNGLNLEAASQPGPRTRLVNADHYMRWVEEYHRKMADDWRAYRDQLQKEDGS